MMMEVPRDDRRVGMGPGRWLPLGLLLWSILLPSQVLGQACDPVGPRKDCGYNGIPQQFCQDKGCCYSEAPSLNGMSPMSLPACFYPNLENSSYVLTNVEKGPNGSGTISGTLTLVQSTMKELGPDVSPLQFTANQFSPDITRFVISAPGRYRVPDELHPKMRPPSVGGEEPNVRYRTSPGPFAFGVDRKGDNNTIFNTQDHRFIFKDQYIEVSTSIPASTTVYGLGEMTNSNGLPLRREGWPNVMWNRDSPASIFDQNTYGSHPFYMEVRSDGRAHGVLMLNSNAQEVSITETRIQWRLTGGIIDLWVLNGPTPAKVLDQLTAIIGRPIMPPYWALGLMQSKYGYGSVEYIDQVVSNYTAFNIPLETFVTDSQYMDKDQDFTLSPTYALEDFQAFVARLHRQGQRWVPILDPGIHVAQGYTPYEQGTKDNIWIKDITGNPYVGQLWPGVINFPDFIGEAGKKWWNAQISGFYADLPLDGLWLDMNEISNYCTGDVCIDPGDIGPRNDFVCELKCENGPDAFKELFPNRNGTSVPAGFFDPPFSINNQNAQRPLSEKTVAVTAAHPGGQLEYNVHNLYSLYEVKTSAETLRGLTQKRHFILTRSTFLGSGAYAAHWTGDTASEWADMQYSIPSILTNGLSGITFSGADICGFMNYPQEELCARWAAIGAWYPYARNHHAQGFQEFYRWESVAEAARQNFGWRYRALPYLYTAFYDSHVYGCPIARPMFFSWPFDGAARNISYQWMMGDGLLITPILANNSDSVSGWWPEGDWYSLYDKTLFHSGSGAAHTVTANLTDPAPIHVLGGHIIPLAPEGINLTSKARTGPITLVAGLTASPLVAYPCGDGRRCPLAVQRVEAANGLGTACGHMYLDDGDSLSLEAKRDNLVIFGIWMTGDPASGQLTGNLAAEWGYDGPCTDVPWPPITDIIIMGVPGPSAARPQTQQIEAQSVTGPIDSPAGRRRLQQADSSTISTLSFDPATLNAAASSLNGQGDSSPPPSPQSRSGGSSPSPPFFDGGSPGGGGSLSPPTPASRLPPPPAGPSPSGNSPSPAGSGNSSPPAGRGSSPPPPSSGSSPAAAGSGSSPSPAGSKSSPSPPASGGGSGGRPGTSPVPESMPQSYLSDAYNPPPVPANISSAQHSSSAPGGAPAMQAAQDVPYVASGPAGAQTGQPKQSGSVSLPASAAVYDSARRTLTLSNLNLVLSCTQPLTATFVARVA